MIDSSARLAQRIVDRIVDRRMIMVFHGASATTAKAEQPWTVVAIQAGAGVAKANATQPLTKGRDHQPQQGDVGAATCLRQPSPPQPTHLAIVVSAGRAGSLG